MPKRWTEAEVQCVRKYYQRGKSGIYEEIAERLKVELGSERTPGAIRKLVSHSPAWHENNVKKRIRELERENKALSAAMLKLRHGERYNVQQFDGNTARFGVISDTHIGSLYENIEFLHLAYDIFAERGIDTVYHVGDLVDGQHMYRGHEYEIHAHGADAQEIYCAKQYPHRHEIVTYVISGNHDTSFWKEAGLDIVAKICSEREDIVYLGQREADIEISTDTGCITLRLTHPSRGTAYAISYHIQKYVESLTGGEKPHVCCFGHYHKSEYLFYRNIHVFQAGCCQYQTPYMRERNIAAMLGFWIIELTINKKK